MPKTQIPLLKNRGIYINKKEKENIFHYKKNPLQFLESNLLHYSLL